MVSNWGPFEVSRLGESGESEDFLMGVKGRDGKDEATRFQWGLIKNAGKKNDRKALESECMTKPDGGPRRDLISGGPGAV